MIANRVRVADSVAEQMERDNAESGKGLVQMADRATVDVVKNYLLPQVVRAGQEHAPSVDRRHLLHEVNEAGVGIECESVDDDSLLGAASRLHERRVAHDG